MTTDTPRIAVSATVKQDAAWTRAFVAYHLRLGVDLVILFLDDPVGYPSGRDPDDRVVVIDCDAAHWARAGGRPDILADKNAINRALAVRLARQRGIGWIALIDGDELVHCEGDLRAVVRRAGATDPVIRIPPLEAIHDRRSMTGPPFASRFFKVLPCGPVAPLHRLFLRHAWPFSERGFLGHFQGKYMIRTDLAVRAFRAHKPILLDGELPGFRDDIVVLHFDCMTFDDWVRKWSFRLGGGTNAATLRTDRRRQMALIGAALADRDQGRALALYRNWNVFGRLALAAMTRTGVVRRIAIDPSWFER